MLYELPAFNYLQATSIQEATNCLSEYGSRAKILGGGTDLLGLMKDRVVGPKMPQPEVLIDIKKIPGLDKIEYEKGIGLKIGAAATLSTIETSNVILKNFTIIAQAAGSVATKQIRNMGTLGGNLCQRPWCWYFRVPNFDCYKKGGKQCYAITGNNKYYFSILGQGICVMSHPSDLAPALIALDASVKVEGSGGSKRILPLSQFFNGPRETFETILKDDEILTEVLVPDQAEGTRGVYLKERLRETWDFALSGVAVVLRMTNGHVCEDVKIVLSGVAPYPLRSERAEEALKGKVVEERSAASAASASVHGARPLSMNRYKVAMTRALVKRAILSCTSTAATGSDSVEQRSP